MLTRWPDSRALAPALFLRRWASAFSFSADALDSPFDGSEVLVAIASASEPR